MGHPKPREHDHTSDHTKTGRYRLNINGVLIDNGTQQPVKTFGGKTLRSSHGVLRTKKT